MRCPRCGAPTTVLESRSEYEGFVLRRRRRCYNQHVYTTYEINEKIITTLMPYLKSSAAASIKATAIYKRNVQIVKAAKLGKTGEELAVQFGIKSNSVSAVLKKFGISLRRRREKIMQLDTPIIEDRRKVRRN